MKKLKIMDWLVHGGHQYEFFKTNHNFFCTKMNGIAPLPDELGRPRNKNVNYVSGKRAVREEFDIIIVRLGVSNDTHRKFRYHKSLNIPGIAVIQTHTPFSVPPWTRCVVWNSKVVMDKFKGKFKRQKHFYIPHGFDHNEFEFLNLKRNNKMLSAVSVFEKRGKLLGFDNWQWVSDRVKKSDLLGHGNDGLKESIGSFPLEGLVQKYNEYGVFLNTTTKSAMPRTRAEALMCGTPLVTTSNYGIDRYLVDGESCLFANSKEEMLKAVKRILASKQLQKDLGSAGREAAIKYFGIKKYIKRWNEVFAEALR